MNLKLAIKTPDGVFTAHYTERGLAQLDFPQVRNAECGVRNSEASASAVPDEIARWHKLTTKALSEALEGRAPRELPPLDTLAVE